ncbi:MAG TPA: antibiotic biosynthesis monooxygenase [Bryobacteraceae bacterium]|nr:antibiotic biosynthesis monooxygenase [Bryobacteraceae bacterium]
MEVVLTGKFAVPKAPKDTFLEAVRRSAAFRRTLPGFMEGFVYEKQDRDSHHNLVTTAVWKDGEAFPNAKKSAVEGFRKIGFNPPEVMLNLQVQLDRAVYHRSSY